MGYHHYKLEAVMGGGLLILALLVGCAGAATWIVDPTPGAGNFTTIQAAINAANATDIILVNSGNYTENVVVNKPLTLLGNDTGTGLPAVDARGSGNVITISADDCTLDGFVAKNSGSGSVGIKVTSKRNNITNNTATDNYYGIRLYSSSNNRVSGNTASENTDDGISLDSSDGNTISGNIATGNTGDAIYLYLSNNNNISKNTVTDSYSGVHLLDSSNNNISENTADGNDRYGFFFGNSYWNTVSENTGNGNQKRGIFLTNDCNSNTIKKNAFNDNVNYGIYFWSSGGNTISENTVTRNGRQGIYLQYSGSNTIYLNTFENTDNAYSDSSNNWNSTTTVTWVHKGRSLTGLLGNVWSDYDDFDCDEDGIGDTPYRIEDKPGMDYHPIGGRLCRPAIEVEKVADKSRAKVGDWISYTIQVNNIGNVTIEDVRAEDNLTLAAWDVGTLESGQSYTNTTSYLVNLTDLPGPLTNELWANGTDPDGIEVNDSAIETVEVRRGPVIEVEKTVSPSGGLPGDELTFTINVTNIGDANFTEVEVADLLPVGLVHISSTPDGTVAGKNVTWNLGTLDSGNSTSIEMTVDIESGTPSGILTNSVNATGTPSVEDSVSDEAACNVGIGIQAAIDAASPGDTIEVPSGTYHENVNVTKQLTLRGISSPVVDAAGSGTAITISADGCNLEGFVARNSGDRDGDAGIRVDSCGSTIKGNTVTSNDNIGIHLRTSCNDNTIEGNTATNNDNIGIRLDSSSNNTVSGNNATNNYNGIRLDSSSNNTVSGNTVNSNENGIRLSSSSDNTVSDNTVNSNENGICLSSSSDNTVSDNTATGNQEYGILFSSSSSNIITGNTATDNGLYGIRFDSSDGNTIYLNTFENADNAWSDSSNHWNATTTVTREYDSWNLTGLLGNVWSDYDGFDCDGDGIGDTPYNISGGSEMDYNPIGGNLCGSAIEVEKVADKSEAVVGEVINYTIWVNNTGNVTLTGVWAEDNLTSAVWDVGYLGPGENYTNTTWYRVNLTDLPGPLTNELSANGTDPCGSDVNSSAIETVGVLRGPFIEVEKTASPTWGFPGNNLTFTINVTNTGDVNFTEVEVADLLPAGLAHISSTPNGTVAGNNVTWALGTLDPGDSALIEMTVDIESGTASGNLTNQVNATGVPSAGDSVSDGATCNVGVGIQAAIDAASPCDVIEVPSGTYYEHVNVNKQLTLRGNDTGSGLPVVDAGGSGNAITLSADGCTLVGFVAQNAGLSPNAGIRVTSSGNTISGNTANANVLGILLYESNNNTISDNIANYNEGGGIRFSLSSGNTVSDNTATGNTQYGIYLNSSSYNNISDNTATYSVLGIHLENSDDNTVEGNTATGNYNYGIHLENSESNTVEGNDANANLYGIVLSSYSNGNTISGNTATGNSGFGIYLYSYSNGNTISGNTVSNNLRGILLYDSSKYNIISDNIADGNTQFGICLASSDGNTIEDNTASDSPNGIYLSSSNNNTILANNVTGNSYGIDLDTSCNGNIISVNNACGNSRGISLGSSCGNTIISGNTASDNTQAGIIVNGSNNIISDNIADDNTMCGIMLGGSDNTVLENTVSGTSRSGIVVYQASSNTISENMISENDYGAILSESTGNTISENTVTGSSEYGICLSESTGNAVYLNTFENAKNAWSNSSNNNWNATTSVTWEHEGRNLTGLLGNVWSDYDGFDCDGDGVGDMPYDKIEGGSEMDYHPIGGKLCGSRIEVEKVADLDEAVVGEVVNYTIFVNNTGNVTLTSVRAEDNLTSAVWMVGDLAPGENYTNTTSYLVNETDLPGPLTNELSANGTDPCGFDVNSSAIETVGVLRGPFIEVEKTVSPSCGLPGTSLTFTINVTNTGDVNFTEVEVADLLPAGLAHISSTPNGTVAGNNVTWNLGLLGPGSTTSIEMVVEIESGTASGILTNMVNVTGTPSVGDDVSDGASCNVGVGIQAAIDAASPGDTIVVPNGTYYENVNVTKQLTLRGVGSPVVDARGDGSAITISAGGCTLEGFVAQNSGDSEFDAGIKATSDSNIISGNTVTNNNGYCSIFFYDSDSNIVSGNTVTDNNKYGIFFYESSGNTIEGNTVTDNGYAGIYLNPSDGNTISSNTVTGNGCDGIYLASSDGNTISDNTVTDNAYYGISFCESSNSNTISGNTVTGSIYGIYLASSDGNTIEGNTVAGNTVYGIHLRRGSDGNTIYLNTFENADNARSDSANNWNATTNVTWEHEGRNFTGFLGNVWSDYDGFDCDGDGVGDTPYKIEGGSEMDYHPIGGKLCSSRIEVEKVADRDEAVVGDVINYTIFVNNTGNATLTNVWAEDNLTSALWDVGDLRPGENYTGTTSHRVNETDLPGPITNRLCANGTDPCGFDVNSSAIETVSVLYDPGIEVDKTTNLSFGAPSTTIEFKINVTNTGNVNFSIVNVTDYLPSGLEYVSDDQPTRTIDGDNVTWNLGPLNRTETRTIELVAHIDGTAFGTLKNRAEAAGTAPLGDEVTDGDEAEVEALKAEIEVEKTGEVDYGPASTNVTFTITVENAGNITLTKVGVVDVLPDGLIYLSSSPAGTEVGKTIIWPDIGPLAETGTAEIKIFTRVDGAASGSLTNEVAVTGTPEHGRNVTDQDNATVMATLDFGDAPDPTYPTLLSNDGARHVIVPDFMLGSEIDGEHDGRPTAGADGDDMTGVDDEDGVTFTTYLVPGGFANIVIEATASGKLDAWIDFGGDGSWTATDQIFDSEPIASGTNYLQFKVAETATPGVKTFARFRFSSAGGLSPTGLVDDGEVEDYTVEILEDSDGDGAPDELEGQGDRDGDGIRNYLDYDPSGYFYNESDGQIISGGKISVTGPGNVTIVEDGSGGYYEFWTDGTPGVYVMVLTLPSGYILSPTCSPGGTFDPTNEPDDPVYLGSDENGNTGYLASDLCADNPYYLRFDLEPGDPFVMTNNIPLARLNSIGDLVWNDLDGDGCQDDDESGVPDVPVALQYENGTKVAETTTGPGGLYLFSDILPGGYRIQFEAPPGCSFSPTHQCDESMDSDADPVTGLTDLVVLETNENEMAIDAGLHTSLNVSKTVDKKSAKRGEELTYTIRICNLGNLTATNVVVEDVFDRSVEFVSASPMPDPDGVWRFDEIPAGECVEIVLVVRVPKQDLEFDMGSGVSGRGYVNVADDYSTTLQPYVIKNNVKVTSGAAVATDSESVSISGEPGTELETREHGSGIYDSEEMVRMRTENKSISMNKDVTATYAPTTLGLYRNRTAIYTSKWTEEARAKNRITGASMSESYRYASRIDRESMMFLDENESVMEIEAEFDGMGHVGFLKKGSVSGAESASTFEAREDYVGSFKVLERVDEYGSAVSSEKSASGEGLVAVDKRVGESQRSYESGTGAYDSEELIETNTNYIAKEISLVSGPMNYSSTDDFSINFDQKWKEGMYSKTTGTNLIGEEYSSIESLDKETVALGLNEMDTLANFSGRARYRAVLRDEVDIDEEYEGDYSIERRILFTGVPKYDRPHLNVTKTLDGIVEETVIGAKDTTLAGESRDKVIKVATYTIMIENDGNKALGPIRVRDLFPPGAVYINASVRPSELTDSYANWTLTHLAIGDVSTIVLNLDVTKHTPAELVNRVEVCGGIDGDEQVCASNFSAIEKEWLACCTNETISVVKTAKIDPVNQSVVGYRIEIKNDDDVTRVATVTDSLPEGMELVESSIPFASYDGDVVVWNLVEIPASGTAAIDYLAEALWSGRFTNSVEVDARSVDGSIVQPVQATCVIDVGTVEGECSPVSCDAWQPPNWGFVSVCDENCELTP